MHQEATSWIQTGVTPSYLHFFPQMNQVYEK